MTIKLNSLKADRQREIGGDWQDYPEWPGVAFKVRALTYPAYATERDIAFQKLRAKHGAQIPEEDMTKTIGGLFAKHLLLDWRGLDEVYTPELAAEILTDPDYRAVTSAVQWCAARLSEIHVQFMDAEAKN